MKDKKTVVEKKEVNEEKKAKEKSRKENYTVPSIGKTVKALNIEEAVKKTK